jgi:hypothetical protein
MAKRKRTSPDSGAEARVGAVRMKHAPKALALAQKIRAGLLELVALEKTAMAEAQSEFAVFSATPRSLQHALGCITNTCNIAKSGLSADE